jgi:hypothetical protein
LNASWLIRIDGASGSVRSLAFTIAPDPER